MNTPRAGYFVASTTAKRSRWATPTICSATRCAQARKSTASSTSAIEQGSESRTRDTSHQPCRGCHDIEVTDGRLRSTKDGRPAGGASIDELLDRAVAAINRGDRAAATALAGEVLAADSANAEAEDLLAAPSDPGEIRRLTIFFADLVDSTVLSTRVEAETYRLLVGRYREMVLQVVQGFGGEVAPPRGDGVLAVFGYPIAHE